MTETFYSLDQLGVPTAFFTALLLGVAFGAVLERAGFGSARRIAGVFYFTDMTVVKVMFAGMLTAMIGVAMLVGVGWLQPDQLHLMPTIYGAQAVGGLLFGVGFVMSGWCPGTSVVGLASGKLDALVFFAGLAGGALVFNEAFTWLKPLYSLGAQPEVLTAFGAPITVFTLAFSIVGVGAFYFSEWIERRTGHGERRLRGPLLPAFSLALVGAAATLFILPIGQDSASTKWTVQRAGITEELLGIASGGDHMEPEDLADRLIRGDQSLLLVDVRPPAEYRRFHIRGAVNLPMTGLLEGLASHRDLTHIVLYSNGMTHPAQAREVLAADGFHNVYLLTDGLQGFIDRCLRPPSLHNGPLSVDRIEEIRQWRDHFYQVAAGAAERDLTSRSEPVR